MECQLFAGRVEARATAPAPVVTLVTAEERPISFHSRAVC